MSVVLLVLLAGEGLAGPIMQQACTVSACQSSTVIPVSMFGEDERRTELQFAKQRNRTFREIQNRYAASGAITCRGFGKGRQSRSVVYASGQLTARNDIVTTTAHTIIGKDAKPLGDLSKCVFETTVDGRTVSSRLTREFFSGFSDPDDANFAGFDWAVIRLKDPLPVEPYPVVDDLSPLFRWLDVANVTKVANFNFDNWGAKRTRVKSLAECAIKPEVVAWSSGVRGIRTDCDISPGNSGGAVLSELSGSPALIGIMVGTTSASFKRRKKFDLYNDYNIGALVEGEFLRAINDMASVMGVADVQKALDDLGYDPGPIDGVLGKRTRRAISAFQKDRGLNQTGTLSTELSSELQSAVSGNAQVAANSNYPANIVTDLYDWRLASSSQSPARRPDWLPAGTRRPEGFSPESAWSSPSLAGCRNIIACLKESGAPGPALRAAYLLEKTGLVGSYVSHFDEFGPVDLVTIGLSYASAEQSEYALVNSPSGAISLRSSTIRKSNDAITRSVQLKKKFPKATLHMNPRFESYRLFENGKQRFVFAYPVTSGCVVCQPVAQVLYAFDFKSDGRIEKLQPLAVSELTSAAGWYAPRFYSSAQFVDDTKSLQRRLNELGYAAGPVDGVAGRKTDSALREFQRDHGLSETGKIDGVTADVMSAGRPDRQLRRFEMLLAGGSNRATGFGEGLLSRVPLTDREKRIVLANNIAGQLMFEGQFGDALALLQRAKNNAESLRSDRPALYAALLLNLASGSIAAGQNEDADRFAGEAAATLDQQIIAPANSTSGRKANASDAIDGKIVSIAELLIDRTSSDSVQLLLSSNDAGYRHIFTLLYPAEESEPI